MKVQIKKRYLVFPVNILAAEKKVALIENGTTVYALAINLDYRTPDFFAYIDVSRFIGRELELTVVPSMELTYTETDEMELEGIYNEPLRPQVHFTTKNGWSNDPNGLILLDGTYHMFYQHNPCAPAWQNMHWGHATSPDLIHWTEHPIALYPDETGLMFSGSAILDVENRSSLGTKEQPAALLYYTATNPYSQHLAYSTDGFKTIKKYAGNPIIPRVMGSNRDPKVIFCEEWNAYLMALYLDEDIYAIFKSDNLIDWSLIQKIKLDGDHECPDIFPITASDGTRKWVLMGAHNHYAVGTMGPDGFRQIQKTQSLHHGSSAYAGQTFSGLENGRVVRMDWDRWNTKVERFCSQMSIPLTLSLEKTADIYYLCALPVKELECLYDTVGHYSDITLDASHAATYDLQPGPYIVKLHISNQNATCPLTMKIFGRGITISPVENKLSIAKDTVPLSITQSGVDLVLLIDRCSMEAFLDGGRIYTSYINQDSAPDYNLPRLELRASTAVTVDSLALISLKSIWKEQVPKD